MHDKAISINSDLVFVKMSIILTVLLKKLSKINKFK